MKFIFFFEYLLKINYSANSTINVTSLAEHIKTQIPSFISLNTQNDNENYYFYLLTSTIAKLIEEEKE